MPIYSIPTRLLKVYLQGEPVGALGSQPRAGPAPGPGK